MSKYRNRLEIIASILTITSKKAKKTQIMYQANLSYKLLCQYLGEVIDAGLVSSENGLFYLLTDKGKEFLNRHGKYAHRCRSLKEHLNHISNEKAVLERMCYSSDRVARNLNRMHGKEHIRKVTR